MSLPAYDSYQDTSVDWIGTVPSHWDVKSLKRGLRLITGRTDRRSWAVGLENIEGWTGRLVETDADFEGEGVGFESGDVLYGKLRPYLAKVHVADRPGEAVGDFHVLRAQNGVLPQFVGYQLRTHEVVSQLNGSTFGARMPRVGWEFMGGLPLAFPPVAEQAAIAAFLDRETGKIDALVEAQRRLIELLKEKRQAVISHAVTRGLDPTAPMKDSGVEWLGDVPGHWEVVPIRTLFRFVKRQDGDELDVLSVYRDYGVISKASRGDNNNVTPEDLSKYQTVRPGDLVVNKMKAWQGSLGVSRLSGITSPDYAVFQPLHRGVSDYLHLLLRSQRLPDVYRLISNGIRLAQWRLEPEKFKELRMPWPPVAEQQAIAAMLAEVAARTELLASEAETGINLLQERRSALISAAVTGKIDVRSLVHDQVAA